MLKTAKLIFALWVVLIVIVFGVVGAISINDADQKNPGGYCENGYRYDRWSYPAKLMRDSNNKPIQC